MKIALVFMLISVTLSEAQSIRRDSIWAPIRFFMGSWHGEGGGEPGTGKYERDYAMILNNNFVEIHNKSTYRPTSKFPTGEIHEDVGYIFYDNARKTFLLRQLHAEGFANDYVLDSISPDKKTLVFITEAIINITSGWRARETYRILGDNDFEEVFELSPPGKPFTVYTSVRFTRRR